MNIIFLCHSFLLLFCRIINNWIIFSPLAVKRCKKKIRYCRLVCYSLVWADNLTCLTHTAIPAIPLVLEDTTDQNSKFGKGNGGHTVTACCWGSSIFGRQCCGKEHFTLEQRGKILPIPMTKMRTPGPRNTYKHELREHHFHIHVNGSLHKLLHLLQNRQIPPKKASFSAVGDPNPIHIAVCNTHIFYTFWQTIQIMNLAKTTLHCLPWALVLKCWCLTTRNYICLYLQHMTHLIPPLIIVHATFSMNSQSHTGWKIDFVLVNIRSHGFLQHLTLRLECIN